MNILVTGSSGLIGSALFSVLDKLGHQVNRLVRSAPSAADRRYLWDPSKGTIDEMALSNCDVVFHLAGENIADGRWTAAKKSRIRASRVDGTYIVSQTIAGLTRPPTAFVSASAIGYYGDRGSQTVDEDSSPGDGFLPEVCRDWEAATRPAADKGIRVVCARIGVVLSVRDGALAKMLRPFKMGVGGVIGSGRQYMSWIALDDVITALLHVISCDALRGPINLVSPEPMTNREFTRTLGRVLRRPTLFPIPSFVARLAFGEMADALLLGGARVRPRRLTESGFVFRFGHLEDALRHELSVNA